jgi:hypothetical protein
VLLLALAACGGPDELSFDIALANVATAPIHASDETEHDVKLAPGVIIAHDPDFVLFTEGSAVDIPELETLAEDGDPGPLADALAGLDGVFAAEVFAHQDEITYEASASLPGQSAYGQITAPRGSVVTVAFMYGESNDCFFANAVPVEAIVKGNPNLGGLGDAVTLWDAGTEVNQEPGLGPDQAPRQSAPGAGTEEDGVVTAVDGVDASGFTYPAPSDVLQLTATVPE